MTDSNTNDRDNGLTVDTETEILPEATEEMTPDSLSEETPLSEETETIPEEETEPELEEFEDEAEFEEVDTETEPTNEPQKPKNTIKTVFEWVEMFAVYFAVGITILMLFVRHCPVNGESMMNTLNHEDVLLLYTFCYTPENGDIIVCQSEAYGLDRPLVKRVIATAGQTVKIDYEKWTVTVDGVTLNEDYIWKREGKPMNPSDYLPEEFTVPEGQIFVMGDNRNNSKDSRSSEIGFIDERYVVGKVWIRITPNFTVFD